MQGCSAYTTFNPHGLSCYIPGCSSFKKLLICKTSDLIKPYGRSYVACLTDQSVNQIATQATAVDRSIDSPRSQTLRTGMNRKATHASPRG